MTLTLLILFLLAIWWLALAIAVAGDKSRKTKSLIQDAQSKPVASADFVRHQPRWPSWNEYRARPALFLIIPWCALINVTVLIFIWPAILVHKIWLWISRKKHEDHTA
jgi:Na+/H+ antiporter NhaC